MTTSNPSICLVGAGNMGGAILAGWLDNGVPGSSITVIDPGPPAATLDLFASHGVTHETAVTEGLSPGVLMVAVKPQIMDAVLPGLRDVAARADVVVSIAAGKTIDGIGQVLGDVAIVRAMPNTPAQVRRGVTVCVGNDRVSDDHRTRLNELMSAIGSVEWVNDEAMMDAVTALSGSGPAYVFHLAEALAEAGHLAGLPKGLSQRLARATVAGAGELMRQSVLDPAELRKNVTSPGGTTAAALEVLMGTGGFNDLLERAVAAAADRSRELSG